ncbi:MAG TPA: hypothetical protein VIV60_09900 [Polyangiaceae bacterium]
MSKKQVEKAKKAGNGPSKKHKKGDSANVSEQAPAPNVRADDADDIDEEIDVISLNVDVTRETLEETPTRVLTFLRAAGTSAAIQAAMATRGYNREQHLHGWALLHAVSGYQDTALPVDSRVRDAIRQLDEWEADGFQVVAASLKHRYPEQAAFLLGGPSNVTAAVPSVKQLLDRLDALESASDKQQASRTKDEAALSILAQRGIDAKERRRLRELVTAAESAPEVSAVDSEAVARSEALLVKGLVVLRAWFEEWSTIARVAIKRRDYLIRLGLAKHRIAVAGAMHTMNAEQMAHA